MEKIIGDLHEPVGTRAPGRRGVDSLCTLKLRLTCPHRSPLHENDFCIGKAYGPVEPRGRGDDPLFFLKISSPPPICVSIDRCWTCPHRLRRQFSDPQLHPLHSITIFRRPHLPSVPKALRRRHFSWHIWFSFL